MINSHDTMINLTNARLTNDINLLISAISTSVNINYRSGTEPGRISRALDLVLFLYSTWATTNSVTWSEPRSPAILVALRTS